jgi:hypothetical protein
VTYEHSDTSLAPGTYPASTARPILWGSIKGNMQVAVATGGTSKTANLTLTNRPDGNAVRVNWGDGTADSIVAAGGAGTTSHVYSTAGVKPITLTATDGEQITTTFTSV